MFDYKIKTFLKNYTIVEFNEEQIIPILVDFLEKCYNAKRRKLKNSKQKISILSSLDKPLILRNRNAYILSISFGTNELSENLQNPDALIEIISEFTEFCINPSRYNKQKKKTVTLLPLSTFECHA